MQRVIMKSKIHRATVTRVLIDFEGSCATTRDSAPTIVRVDADNRIREQAAIA
ncbi:MAG: aspartate 1-decarboxylase [Candidatus Dormibacteria bacterium]